MTALASVFTPATAFTNAAAERRGAYNQLVAVNGQNATDILHRFKSCLPTPIVEFDSKMRGESLNHDLYGYDPEQNVAVVQCRRFSREYARGYGRIQKTYVLVGFNEHGTPFRHPVAHGPIHGAIRKGADAAGVVRAAQMWMWGVTERQLARSIRQGDVLLVPERSLPANRLFIERGNQAVMAGTHVVHATRIVQAEGDRLRVYALNLRIVHRRDQHEPIGATDHDVWYTVRVADEALAWEFSERLGD